MTSVNHNLFKTFNFIVSIDGLVVGGFTKVSGIERSIEMETYKEGGNNEYAHQLPKSIKTQNLVLERGILEDNDEEKLLKWFQECLNGVIKRKNLFISIINKPKAPNAQIDQMKTWKFSGVYPIKWSSPDMNAMGSEIAFEKIEFVYNKVEDQ